MQWERYLAVDEPLALKAAVLQIREQLARSFPGKHHQCPPLWSMWEPDQSLVACKIWTQKQVLEGLVVERRAVVAVEHNGLFQDDLVAHRCVVLALGQ